MLTTNCDVGSNPKERADIFHSVKVLVLVFVAGTAARSPVTLANGNFMAVALPAERGNIVVRISTTFLPLFEIVSRRLILALKEPIRR